jgi:hypothetical protein
MNNASVWGKSLFVSLFPQCAPLGQLKTLTISFASSLHLCYSDSLYHYGYRLVTMTTNTEQIFFYRDNRYLKLAVQEHKIHGFTFLVGVFSLC